jgi:hypothetical protein
MSHLYFKRHHTILVTSDTGQPIMHGFMFKNHSAILFVILVQKYQDLAFSRPDILQPLRKGENRVTSL